MSIFIKGEWWRSVTPSEMRESMDVVKTFLDGEGVALPHEIEAFARGIALSQLFFNQDAVENVARSALALIRPVQCVRDAKDSARWLARNQAFVAGLARCLELLQPKQDIRWQPLFCCVQLTVDIHEPGLIRGSKSDEAHAEVRAEVMMKEKLATELHKPNKI